MSNFRLVTGVLTVALLGGLASPAHADQTFWTINSGHIPPPAHPADPAAGIGDIYYYGGCGGYGYGGGNGRGHAGIAAQEQPRPYGFGFAPERNPAPRQPGFPGIFAPPQYPSQLGSNLAIGRNGSHRGRGNGSGCGSYGPNGYGQNGFRGGNGHHVHPVHPINPPGVPPRYYPQIQPQAAVQHPMM